MKNLSRFRPQRHGQHLLDLVDPIEKVMIVTQKKVARGISQKAADFASVMKPANSGLIVGMEVVS